jgi:hypothetical protein
MRAEMSSWRNDISTIAEKITGLFPNDFRHGLRLIGNTDESVREAIRLWAESECVFEDNWRNNLIGISYSQGASIIHDWREALRWLAENYSPVPLVNVFMFNTLPRQTGQRYINLENELMLETLYLLR